MRSDTERHWDTVCLGIITLATAALAAVILVSGVADIVPSEAAPQTVVLRITRAVVVGLASLSFILLTLTGMVVVFFIRGSDPIILERKWKYALFTYGLFILEVVFLTMLIPNPPKG